MKIYLDSIGCRLNQSEIEAYARQFQAAGHSLVASPEEADLAVVNTCTVTGAAASDSRQKIRQVHRAGAGEIAVTGCWSSMQPEKAAALPGVQRVIANAQKDELVPLLLETPVDEFEREPLARVPVPGARLRTRAFIKVQDGCDNRCTFCITTLARGAGRSRSVEAVLADVQAALAGGAREVVLTGVHLGSWGQDWQPRRHLSELVAQVLQSGAGGTSSAAGMSGAAPRLRLSSLEPWDLDESFFRLWEDQRLCRHLHLPLQSGCAATLRRMARKTDPGSFARLVEAARAAVPGIAITTDVIVGFPGETEAEFAESLAFVESLQLSGGHVFTYSARAGTAAARMGAQVEHALRKERNAAMRAVLNESGQRYRSRFVGQVLPVLWESAAGLGPGGWEMSGLTDNYLRVRAQVSQSLWNRITPVRLTGLLPGESMRGALLTAP